MDALVRGRDSCAAIGTPCAVDVSGNASADIRLKMTVIAADRFLCNRAALTAQSAEIVETNTRKAPDAVGERAMRRTETSWLVELAKPCDKRRRYLATEITGVSPCHCNPTRWLRAKLSLTAPAGPAE